MELFEAYEVLGVRAETPLSEVKKVYEEALQQCPNTTEESRARRKKIKEAYEVILLNQDMDQAFDSMWHLRKKPVGNFYFEETEAEHKNHKAFILTLIVTLILLNLVPYIGSVVKQLEMISTQLLFGSSSEVGQVMKNTHPVLSDYEKGYADGVKEGIALSKDVIFSISKFDSSLSYNWFYFEEYDLWNIMIPLKIEEAGQDKALINAAQFKLGNASPITEIQEFIHLNETLNTIYYLSSYDTALPIGTTFGLVFCVSPFENNEERVLTYEDGSGNIQEISVLQFNDRNEDDSWKVNLQLVEDITGWR